MKNNLNLIFIKSRIYLVSFVFLLFIPLLTGQSTEIYGLAFQGTSIDRPAESGTESQNPVLNDLLREFPVKEYSIAYSVAKTEKARNCFRIILQTTSEDEYKKLADKLSYTYEEVLLEGYGQPQSCDLPKPNDPCVQDDGGHYLENANVPCAWEITHGDPNMIVAVVDQYLDYGHPDLQGKIVSIWNKVTTANPNGEPVPGCSPANHGFSTTGAIVAIPNNNFCVAGTGYDTKVAFYAAAVSSGQNCNSFPYISNAILQAYHDGHKLINVSLARFDLLRPMVEEIVESGVTIVHSTGGPTHNVYGSIPGVIGVGQIDKDINYVQYTDFGCCWDYNVDIYAPCLGVCRLDHGDQCSFNTGNSSFGSAMTSGIVALMLSVNKNLCPSEIENILELSNQGYPLNIAQWPLMTQGIIDAEAAVLMARDYGKYKITTPTIWNTDHFVSELTIEPGGELTILNANISMGDDASVIVKRNARLIIDNSTLSNCAAKWSGIKVWGNSTKEQPAINAALTDPDQCGIVVMRNNAKLEGAKTGISTSAPGLAWPDAAGYYGGLVDCANSEFIDCRKGVEFMQYPAPLANTTLTNKSHFYNCRFEETSTANFDAVDGSEGVTIWDTDGIKFEKCHFYNMDSDGIVAYDAGASIIDANQFYNNNRGILSVATYPYSSFLEVGRFGLTSNDFNNNKIHIDATATNKLGGIQVVDNDFWGGDKGVYMEGTCNYIIRSNDFIGQTEGIVAVNTGIKNTFQSNFVRCNNFSCESGNVFSGENRQVEVLGNVFSQTGTDIQVKSYSPQGSSITGAIKNTQGTPFAGASNCFTSPVISGDIVTSGSTLPFTYFASNSPNACDAIPNSGGNYSVQQASTWETECPPVDGGGIPPTKDDLANIRVNIKTINDALHIDPDNTTQKEALSEALIEKERILKYLLSAALKIGDYTDAEGLLSGEKTQEALMALYGLKLNRNAYQEAKEILDQLPLATADDKKFAEIQEINIMRLKEGGAFVLTPENKTILEEVAYSDTPVKVYAQGMLTLLTGQRFKRETEVTEYSDRPEQASKAISSTPDMQIMPNPAKDNIRLLFNQTPESAANIQVVDNFGRIALHLSVESLQDITLPVHQLANGAYTIKVQLVNGLQLQQRVVIYR